MTTQKISHAYAAFVRSIGMFAGIVTLLMMLLVMTNVLSRYILKIPISGAFEITQSMLTVTVFFSLALAQLNDSHIRVVLLTDRLSPAWQRTMRVFGLVIGAIFFGWCTYATFGFAMSSYEIGEQEWGSVRYPIYPIKFAVSFGLLVLSIQFVFSAIRTARTPLAIAETDPNNHRIDTK